MVPIAEIVELVAKAIKVAVDLTPTVIKGVEDAKPFAKAIVEMFKGHRVSEDDLVKLEAKIDDLAAQLQEPLPPE